MARTKRRSQTIDREYPLMTQIARILIQIKTICVIRVIRVIRG
jgi:hypothetical protein